MSTSIFTMPILSSAHPLPLAMLFNVARTSGVSSTPKGASLSAGLTVIASVRVTDCPAESVTRTTKTLVPAETGVPEITPPAERFNPAPRLPLAMLQL